MCLTVKNSTSTDTEIHGNVKMTSLSVKEHSVHLTVSQAYT